jgi:hypothetical protein
MSMQHALHVLGETGEPRPTPPVGESLSESLPSLKPLCTAAGWPCLERAPGHWMVEMEGTPGFCQAEITLLNGDLHLRVILGEWQILPLPCEEAITHLLLRAGAIFRMARPAIETQGPRRRAMLLARLPVADLDTDLLHALSALSVGAARMLQEVGALQRPEIAANYLAMTSSRLEETRTRRDDDE